MTSPQCRASILVQNPDASTTELRCRRPRRHVLSEWADGIPPSPGTSHLSDPLDTPPEAVLVAWVDFDPAMPVYNGEGTRFTDLENAEKFA